MKRVLICGGRDFTDRILLYTSLDAIFKERGWMLPEDKYGNSLPDVTIISGMARGADRMAADYATENWAWIEEYPADWDMYGNAAGPIRNKQMLDTDIDLVVACPGGRGTNHMKTIARKAGVEVIEIE